MKIGKLDMHCGECNIIDYCGESFSDISICMEKRFENVEEKDFIKLAKTSTKPTGRKLIDDVYKRLSEKEDDIDGRI